MKKLGYTYQTEKEAKQARKQAANYYGLPKSPNNTTKYFVNYSYSELDNFYYIIWVDGCSEVLGEPKEFDLTQDE